VKLLFDANISRRIVPMLADLFPESSHISLVGLSGETPDKTIWEFAKEEGFGIATADADFITLAERHGAPPQIIRLERMDYSTEIAAALIRRYALAITEFEKSARSVLTLRKN
jgi:predicted nuclease of predicted toxin-antitoxin system